MPAVERIDKWAEGQAAFIDMWMTELPRDANILDIACGDGVGLRHFKELGFSNVTGADLSQEKLAVAARTGYRTVLQDFHLLQAFQDGEFDVVYSSYSLQHALHPDKVLREFHRVCRKDGLLFLVLPYPDSKAHCGKYKLGTHENDNGASVVRYVEKHGFSLIQKEFDSFREPEIWLKFRRS